MYMSKYVCIDFEMTGLSLYDDSISLGAICGKSVFYAEFNDYVEEKCTEWIHENVINNLEWNYLDSCLRVVDNDAEYSIIMKGNTDEIKNKFVEWINKIRGKDDIIVVTDCGHFDMAHLCSLFGSALELPDYIYPVAIDINPLIAEYYGVNLKEAFNMNREEIYKELVGRDTGSKKHNSLYDASIIAVILHELGRHETTKYE